VNAADWEDASPCEGWSARDVVRHLVDWVPGFLQAGAGVDTGGGPSVDDDPVASWAHLDHAIDGLLAEPDVPERVFDHPRAGRHPLDEAIDRFVTGDVLIHTWDLARATGQDETLDPDMVATMLEGIEPMADVLEQSGQYGRRVAVPVGASPQTRLLALTRRDPS
jgi:uncharacterized protein (TIGR03086 family)